MTSKPTDEPGAPLDQRYEEDLRELFERLLKGARPAAPEPEGTKTAEAAESGDDAAEDDIPEAGDSARGETPDEPGEEAEDKAEENADKKAGEKTEEKAEGEAHDGTGRTGEEPAGSRIGRARTRGLVVPAAAVVVAAAVGAAGFSAGRASGPDADAARRQVAVRAGEIANTLYNYDYQHVDQYFSRQSSVMTTEMAGQVKQSRDTISAIITGGKLVWNSRVVRVYVADVTITSASTIVELNGKVTNSKGISTLTGTVVRFQLAKARGVWLISKAPETLTVGDESATDLSGKPLPSASTSASPSARATPR